MYSTTYNLFHFIKGGFDLISGVSITSDVKYLSFLCESSILKKGYGQTEVAVLLIIKKSVLKFASLFSLNFVPNFFLPTQKLFI